MWLGPWEEPWVDRDSRQGLPAALSSRRGSGGGSGGWGGGTVKDAHFDFTSVFVTLTFKLNRSNRCADMWLLNNVGDWAQIPKCHVIALLSALFMASCLTFLVHSLLFQGLSPNLPGGEPRRDRF